MPITWTKEKYQDRPDYTGCVLACPVYHPQAYSCDYETVYASVWTGESIKDVDIGVGGYSNWTFWGKAVVDADDHIRQLAQQWQDKVNREAEEYGQCVRDWISATTITKGDYVERISGRKPPIGTTGYVDYIGQTTYGESIKVGGRWGGKPHTWHKVLSRDHVEPVMWRRIQLAIERLDNETLKIYAKHPYHINKG